MHYRTNFLVAIRFGSVLVGFLTMSPELLAFPFIPRQHCIAIAGPLAVLVGVN